ncbi:MAG: hypothetical protein ACI35K_04580 [Campylobacter sp.]
MYSIFGAGQQKSPSVPHLFIFTATASAAALRAKIAIKSWSLIFTALAQTPNNCASLGILEFPKRIPRNSKIP